MSVSIKTDVNYTTYGDEILHAWELTTQRIDGVYTPLTTSGNVSWTSHTSGIVYSTASSVDPNVYNKGSAGLLYWLNSLLNLSTGDGGYGNSLIDASYLSSIVSAIIKSELNYAEDAGASDAYAVSLEIAPSAYTSGLAVNFKANTANTGACTLNVNGLGAIAIKDVKGNDLVTGAILANQLITVIHNGTNFILISACPVPFISKIANTGLLTLPTSTDTLVGRDTTDTLTNKTLTSPVINTPVVTSPSFSGLIDGWTLANETWAYASASTITVPAGAASKYQKGDKIRLKQGAGYKYFYIIGVANTLLTVTGGSDFTVATPTAITDNYYSHVENPMGFPGVFNVGDPTWDTTTIDNGTANQQPGPGAIKSFKIIGNNVLWSGNCGTAYKNGAGTYIDFTIPSTLPSIATPAYIAIGTCFLHQLSTTGSCRVISGTSVHLQVLASMSDNQVLSTTSFQVSYLF